MISIPPVPITIGTVANDGNDSKQTGRLVSMRPTPGAFLICTAMCGNGSMTGKQTTRVVPSPILSVRHRARIGSYGVVPGTTAGRTCVRLSAQHPPSARATLSASVLVSRQSSQIRRTRKWNFSGERGSRMRPGKPGRSQAPLGTMCVTEI